MSSERPAAIPKLGWGLVLAGSVLCLGLADAVVLDLTKAYFSSGYMGHVLHDAPSVSVFFLVSAVLDLALVSGLWLLLRPVARGLRLSPLRGLAFVGSLSLGLPLLADLAIHRLHRVLGDVLHLDILFDLAGGSVLNAAAEAWSDAPTIGFLGIVAAGGVGGLLFVAGRLERRFPALASWDLPSGRRSFALFIAATVVGMALLVWTNARSDRIAFGLNWKPSGRGLTLLVQRITDVDRDGFGVLSRPPDPAPFDGGVFPFALDVAGNGVDENGLAGDLPLDFEPLHAPYASQALTSERPPFLFLFLESFRADLIGMRVDGREVTPFLNRLAREGASSDHAYVHASMTWNSRAQLFEGRLAPTRGVTTLVDDLKGRGYRVAWLSGQDDSFGRGAALLGFDRADHFYDARQDKDRRTSRSAQPVSLQVSWKTLLERVEEYLDDTPRDRPLALYVNLVDSHFPFDHSELDPIFLEGRFPRNRIRPENAAEVWTAYLNTVANVDRGARLVTKAFERHLGHRDYAILVTADHGETFYETGQLGHGQRVDEAQTRVPLILWGIGGEWPEPLAFSDLRSLLNRHLFAPRTPRPQARFAPDPEREIFQYTGAIERPKLLGLRSLAGSLVYDVSRDVLEDVDEAGESERRRVPRETDADFVRLIRNWEAARNARAEELERLEAKPADRDAG